MHTTASDGRLTPAELVARVSAAGLTTISVTDHDTVGSIAEVTELARPRGIRVVPGIELTAVDRERDVHVLGYFFDAGDAGLAAFCANQRALRTQRMRDIAERLASLNMPIDEEKLLKLASTGASVGRPQIARELLRAGHVSSVQEAFDLWLATGQPAFIPRVGKSPADAVQAIHAAGGIASFAHPGSTKRDDLIEPLVAIGLDALEVYHSDHSPEQTAAYRETAERLGLAVSGGSDFHGQEPASAETSAGAPPAAKANEGARSHRAVFGAVSLPPADFDALEAAARRKHGAAAH